MASGDAIDAEITSLIGVLHAKKPDQTRINFDVCVKVLCGRFPTKFVNVNWESKKALIEGTIAELDAGQQKKKQAAVRAPSSSEEDSDEDSDYSEADSDEDEDDDDSSGSDRAGGSASSEGGSSSGSDGADDEESSDEEEEGADESSDERPSQKVRRESESAQATGRPPLSENPPHVQARLMSDFLKRLSIPHERWNGKAAVADSSSGDEVHQRPSGATLDPVTYRSQILDPLFAQHKLNPADLSKSEVRRYHARKELEALTKEADLSLDRSARRGRATFGTATAPPPPPSAAPRVSKPSFFDE